MDDERIKYWVECQQNFDEVLWFSNDIKKRGIKKVEKDVGLEWETFVNKSTNELLGNYKD